MGLDRGSKRLRNLLIGLDFCVSFLAWVAVLAFAGHHAWHARFAGTIPAAAALSLVTIGLLAAHRLYRARVCAVRSVELSGIARSAGLSGVAAFWLTHLEHAGPSLTILTVGAACSGIALMGSRLGTRTGFAPAGCGVCSAARCVSLAPTTKRGCWSISSRVNPSWAIVW